MSLASLSMANTSKGVHFRCMLDWRGTTGTFLLTSNYFTVSAGSYDVAVDDNEVYVAVQGYNRIEVFNQNRQCIRTIGNTGARGTGKVQTAGLQLGKMQAGNIQINSPSAIAIQGGVLYVVESSNCRVQKLTTSGMFISGFGTRGIGNGQLSNPRGICLDSSGCVFISDCGNNRISVFEADGTFLYHIIGNTADGSNLNGPWGLAFDQCGNLHVADSNTGTIKVFAPQGRFVTQYDSGVIQPAGIAIDEEGHIFVAEHNNCRLKEHRKYQNRGYMSQSNQVCVLDSKHTIIHSFGIPSQNATGKAIDKEGSVYVCCINYKQIKNSEYCFSNFYQS